MTSRGSPIGSFGEMQVFEVLPDWGEVSEGVCSKSWQVPERVAKRWFDLLAYHSRIPYHQVAPGNKQGTKRNTHTPHPPSRGG